MHEAADHIRACQMPLLYMVGSRVGTKQLLRKYRGHLCQQVVRTMLKSGLTATNTAAVQGSMYLDDKVVHAESHREGQIAHCCNCQL